MIESILLVIGIFTTISLFGAVLLISFFGSAAIVNKEGSLPESYRRSFKASIIGAGLCTLTFVLILVSLKLECPSVYSSGYLVAPIVVNIIFLMRVLGESDEA